MIIDQIFSKDKKSAYEQIIKHYKIQNYCIINYIYFANIVKHIYENPKKSYINNLQKADLVLPDGIALQLLYQKLNQKRLNNLNGTDFIEYFFKKSIKDFKNIKIAIYGTKQKYLDKATNYIKNKYPKIKIITAQNGYKDFDWSKVKTNQTKQSINILIVGLPTPMQENWTIKNKSKIKQSNLITFTQGGTLDFWGGRETRASKAIRSLKLEWLWRALSNPSKNLGKTLTSLKIIKYLIKPKRF